MSTTSTDLAAHLAALPTVGLPDLTELPLLRRYEDKHLVPVGRLPDLLEGLAGRFDVLEVDGERAIAYTTTYFDTPELLTYHAHRQERRRRFKVRTRHYGNPAAAVLEVKAKGVRGRTVKHRIAHAGPALDDLGVEGAAFVAATLDAEYGLGGLPPLAPVLQTRFVRASLTSHDLEERLTIDCELSAATPDGRFDFSRAWAIVESKTTRRHPMARPVLHRLGGRPERVSKYCLGVAALHPELPSNRWRRAQRRLAPTADAA